MVSLMSSKRERDKLKELFRQFFFFAMKNPLFFLMSELLYLVATIATYINPLIFSKIINDGLMKANVKDALLYIILSFIISVVQLSVYASAFKLQLKCEYDFFRFLQNRVYTYFLVDSDEVESSDKAVAVTTDIPSWITLFTSILFEFPLQFISAIVAIVLIVRINYFIGAITIILQSSLIVVRFVSGKRIQSVFFEKRTSYSKLVEKTMLPIRFGNLLQAIGSNNYYRRSFESQTDDFISVAVKADTKNMENQVLFDFLFTVLKLIQIGLLVFACVNTDINIGQLLAFLQYTGLFQGPIEYVISFYNGILQKKKEINQCIILLRLNSTKQNNKESVKECSTISIRNIDFKYGDRDIFVNSSADFGLGKVNIIEGESGIGKSSLLEIIMGINTLNSGCIAIDNRNINDYSVEERAEFITFVPQEPIIFCDTLKNNLTLGFDVSDEFMDKVIKMTHLEHVITSKGGLDTIVENYGDDLSLGEKQRISLARAILRDRPILIVDEVVSGLNRECAEIIEAALMELAKTKIVVYVTHSQYTITGNHFLVEGRRIKCCVK